MKLFSERAKKYTAIAFSSAQITVIIAVKNVVPQVYDKQIFHNVIISICKKSLRYEAE